MKNELRGKTVLVTGSGKNLGRHLALSMAEKGAKIAVHFRDSLTEATATISQVKKYSSGEMFRADLTEPAEVNTMFKHIEKKLGTVEILINLIGNFIYQPIAETSFAKFKDVIESNLYATFLCSQQALPEMKKKKWGRIINFGAVAADTITIRKNTTPYYMAKTAVIMLTKVMAFEYAKYGITVNSISPGILKTSFAKPKTPTGKFAQFEDISAAVHFLLSTESAYINGANLEISGGWRPGFSS